MHNLKEYGGSFKGLVGECMFKMTRKYTYLTRFHPKKKFFYTAGKYLTIQQTKFLDNNWFSLDCIEIQKENNKFIPVLFEVKTQNYLRHRPHWWKPKMTFSTEKLYAKAKQLGFQVKLVIVSLHDDWCFNVRIEDFQHANYCVDKVKKYDLDPET